MNEIRHKNSSQTDVHFLAYLQNEFLHASSSNQKTVIQLIQTVMEKEHFYGTVTDAIKAFKDQGFLLDLNLEENQLRGSESAFSIEDFEIVAFYRYEGISDPADGAMVYAIESNLGHKGILVTGYGIYTSSISEKLLKKLSFRHENYVNNNK